MVPALYQKRAILLFFPITIDIAHLVDEWKARRPLENANAIPSCAGKLEEAHSVSCGSEWLGRPPQEQSDEEKK